MFDDFFKWLDELLNGKPSISEAELKKMTKKEVDEYAASRGINLDRRLTKAKMIDLLKQHLNVD